MQRPFRFICLLLSLVLCTSPLCGCAILFPDAYTTTTSPSPNTPTGNPQSGYDLVLRYDDRVPIDGTFVRIDIKDTKDSALLRADDKEKNSFTLRAVGVGSADLYVKRNGEEVCLRVLVEPAPLNILLMLGEEAACGTASTEIPSPRSANGLIYYTCSGGIPLSSLPSGQYQSAESFVPSRLTDNKKSLAGTDLPIPTDELTTSGKGRYAGLCAPIAYQLVEATGERVWMINLAQANASIDKYQLHEEDPKKSPALFRNALALWEAAAGVLENELSANHYTVSRFGFIFCQGESDVTMSDDAYYAAFSSMKKVLDAYFTFETENGTRRLDFGGLILPRNVGADLSPLATESGVRAAQRRIADEKTGPLANVYLLSDAVDAWDTDGEVAAYFARYDFRNFFLYYGYEPPKTAAELFAGRSYTAIACNELGYDAVKTLLSIGK